MAALTVDFRKHNGPTPADDMAPQIITDCGNFTLDFKQHGICASPLFLQTLGPCFQMKCKIYFHLKRGLWTTELFFSTAQVSQVKSKVKVCFIVNSATCTGHTYRELKLRYSLTPWCIQITLN